MYQLIIDGEVVATYDTYPFRQAVSLANEKNTTVTIWEPDEGEPVLTVHPTKTA